MKRIIVSTLAALAVWSLAFWPGVATAACTKLRGYAQLCADNNKLVDSQHPDHVVVINGATQTLTGNSTSTYTITAVATATNTLYSAGGLIWLSSVNDTATGTGTGSTTATQTMTRDSAAQSPIAYTWIATGTRTATLSFSSTGTTTKTLTVTGFAVDSATRTGSGTGTQTRTVTATYTGTATATGTNTGTGTTSGTAVATATGTNTITASSTSADSSLWEYASVTVEDTQTHTATGWQPITFVVSATETGTTTNTSPGFGVLGATVSATATVTGTASGTWTNTTTHTVTGTSALVSDNPTVSDTKSNTHILGTPFGANKTLSTTGTTILMSSDLATESPTASAIPLAKTTSKIDIGWLPTGTATDSVVTGADPRLTDSRASTNTVYQGTTNVSFTTGTSTDTATSAAVADNPKIHVSVSTAADTYTLSVPSGTSTWSNTLTITQTHIGNTGTGTGIIPMTGTNSKINQAVVPWGLIASDVLPSADATYDLGSAGSSKRWQDGYFSGTVTAGAFAGPGIFSNWQHVETTGATASTHAWTAVASYSYLYWPDSKIVASGTFTVATNTSTNGGCCARIVLDSTVISSTICASAVTVGNNISLATNGAADVASGSHAVTLQVYDSGDTDCAVPSGFGGITVSIFAD